MTVERYQRDCAEAHQAVNVLIDKLMYWGHPVPDPLVGPLAKLLDNLAAAANGDPRPHDDLLPFDISDDWKYSA